MKHRRPIERQPEPAGKELSQDDSVRVGSMLISAFAQPALLLATPGLDPMASLFLAILAFAGTANGFYWAMRMLKSEVTREDPRHITALAGATAAGMGTAVLAAVVVMLSALGMEDLVIPVAPCAAAGVACLFGLLVRLQPIPVSVPVAAAVLTSGAGLLTCFIGTGSVSGAGFFLFFGGASAASAASFVRQWRG